MAQGISSKTRSKWRVDHRRALISSRNWWRIMLATALLGVCLFATHNFCTSAYCFITAGIFEILSMRAANKALQIEKLQLKVTNSHLMDRYENGPSS